MQVWFKSDLRVDDHPGLHLASKAARVLPVFCFDPKLHTHLLRTPNGLEGKLAASVTGGHRVFLSLHAKSIPGLSHVLHAWMCIFLASDGVFTGELPMCC